VKVPAKLFSESEMRAVAQALGDTTDGLTNAEIDDLLQYCHVPDEVGEGTKWKRIFYSLWNHQVRKGTRTNGLEFIRQAMQPARHIRNPGRFTRMRDGLNIALSFAGLYVTEAGVLEATERVETLPEAERRAQRASWRPSGSRSSFGCVALLSS
jgi:hypothetical protein